MFKQNLINFLERDERFYIDWNNNIYPNLLQLEPKYINSGNIILINVCICLGWKVSIKKKNIKIERERDRERLYISCKFYPFIYGY